MSGRGNVLSPDSFWLYEMNMNTKQTEIEPRAYCTITNDSDTNTSLTYYVLACDFPFACFLISIFYVSFSRRLHVFFLCWCCFTICECRRCRWCCCCKLALFFHCYHFPRQMWTSLIKRQSKTLSCIRMYTQLLTGNIYVICIPFDITTEQIYA